MKSYCCSVIIAAPAASVYEALTTAKGLQGWWTATCEVGAEAGALSTFWFGQTHNVMRIERLEPDREVVWRCVKQHHHAPSQLTRTDEWIGTRLVFQLAAPTPASTILEFEHIGLMPGLECYEICDLAWDHFLKRSLKNYVETGRGEPFIGGAA